MSRRFILCSFGRCGFSPRPGVGSARRAFFLLRGAARRFPSGRASFSVTSVRWLVPLPDGEVWVAAMVEGAPPPTDGELVGIATQLLR